MIKRIKRLFKKRNNAGFTMVEVIVSSALLGILILGVMGFMIPVLSTVAESQKTARATMLTEAIDSYVVNSVRNCKYMKIFTNVKPQDVDNLRSDADFQQMLGNMGTDDELRCISFQWKPTTNNQYKLLLMHDNVDNTGEIISSTEVMGDIMYDGLYVVPEISTIDNNYLEPDPTDPSGATMKYHYSVGDPELRNIGISVYTNVYSDIKCYSTTEAVRQDSHRSFVGESHNACITVSSLFSNQPLSSSGSTGYKYKIYDNDDRVYDTTGVNSSLIYKADDGGDCFYPETYIYYVVRKIKATTTP